MSLPGPWPALSGPLWWPLGLAPGVLDGVSPGGKQSRPTCPQASSAARNEHHGVRRDENMMLSVFTPHPSPLTPHPSPLAPLAVTHRPSLRLPQQEHGPQQVVVEGADRAAGPAQPIVDLAGGGQAAQLVRRRATGAGTSRWRHDAASRR